MASKTKELQDILQTLDVLQARVQDLSSSDEADAIATAEVAAELEIPRVAVEAVLSGGGEIPTDMMALLRTGISELTTLSRPKDFPQYFQRLSRRTGLRMLLLKRWTSGLQVFLEENIKMPSEAKSKRSDGRAPIPCTKQDIFAAVAQEASVYCGPVPVKHFPLDLTLMLGRGSRDRQIVILPLPSQNHWNTYLYLDSDQATEKALAVAEVLAHFALARMRLLNEGVNDRQGQVAGILRAELHRRRNSQAKQAQPVAPTAAGDTAEHASDQGDGLQWVHATDGPSDALELDPFRTVKSNVVHPESEPDPIAPSVAEQSDEPAQPKRVRRTRSRDRNEAPTAAEIPDAPAWDGEAVENGTLTPEIVLHHSGELPALPRAACHIMAVIEDPRTTATKLEKALAMDQALTAKVLRIANSPFYGAVREISTVSEAIVRLGFVTIRNWTLVTATRSVFLAPGAGLLYRKIWRQSVLSAMSGQMVAQTVGRAQPESVFIGGLMQNIGQLVLARSHPELFQEILGESVESGRPYHEVERQLLGFDHGELGALLLREWNLSADLEEAVRWHHRFTHPDARNARVAAMIALGEEVANCHSGDDESASAPEAEGSYRDSGLSEAASFLGLTAGRVSDLVAEAGSFKIDPHFFN